MVNSSYENPQITNLHTSYSFSHQMVTTYVYASTATTSPDCVWIQGQPPEETLVTQRLAKDIPAPDYDLYPYVFAGIEESELTNMTHFPITTWQAYYDLEMFPEEFNAQKLGTDPFQLAS